MSEVVVVGAGPAGLTAAWRAALGGRDVRLVERSPAVGGLAASTVVAGQRVDLGSHRLHPSIAPHLLAALQELLGGDLQLRRRHGRVRVRDRWIQFPLRLGDAARHLPRDFVARAALDALSRPFRRPRDDTFAEVVRVRLGRAMLHDFYGPYATKLWGLDPDRLEGELARRRISATGPLALAGRVFRRESASGRTFLYPRTGYGTIVERLAEAATAAGVRIELGRGVASLTPGPGGVGVGLDDGTTVDAGRVLWTGPSPALAAALGEAHAPAAVRASAARLRHRAVVLVYLVVDQPRYSEFDAHYLPARDLAVARLTEPKNYRDGPDPPDRTVLCAEVPCDVDDATWRDADDDLGALVVECAARAGLAPIRPAAVETRRLPRVYPVYDVATSADRHRVDGWSAGLDDDRIAVFGRPGLFVADNLHHVMAMGWDAGELAARGWDVAAWRRARASYRSHVVED